MKKDETEKDQQNYPHNNVESEIVHNNLFIAVISNKNIADNENNADYNVGDKEIIHKFDLGKNLSPSNRASTTKRIPEEKVSRLKSLPALRPVFSRIALISSSVVPGYVVDSSTTS